MAPHDNGFGAADRHAARTAHRHRKVLHSSVRKHRLGAIRGKRRPEPFAYRRVFSQEGCPWSVRLHPSASGAGLSLPRASTLTVTAPYTALTCWAEASGASRWTASCASGYAPGAAPMAQGSGPTVTCL